jgi:hypothetical protein
VIKTPIINPKDLLRAIGVFGAILAILIDLVLLFHTQGLLDYGAFLASGYAVQNHANPYTLENSLVTHDTVPFLGTPVDIVNLNPPALLPLASLATHASPTTGFLIWRCFSVVCFLLVLFLVLRHSNNRSPGQILWAFALAGLWESINLGQVYLPLVLLSTIAWISLKTRRFSLAGVMIGILISIKPNFAVWSLMLLIGGYGLVAAISAIVAATFSLIPVFLYGVPVYFQWFEATRNFSGIALPNNISLIGFWARVGFQEIGTMLSILLIGSLLLWVYRTRPDQESISVKSLLGSLLASPIAWTGYTLFLLPVFFSRRWNARIAFSAVMLAIPSPIISNLARVSPPFFIIFGAWYGFALIPLILLDINTFINIFQAASGEHLQP